MMLEHLVILPSSGQGWRTTATGREPISAREAERYDDFAAALAPRTAAEIAIREGQVLPSAREGGTVFLCPLDVIERSAGPALADTVLLHALPVYAFAQLERFGLAAAIGMREYMSQLQGRAGEETNWMYGRRDVAEAMGATWREQSGDARYVRFTHLETNGLPDLLIAYLEAYIQRDRARA